MAMVLVEMFEADVYDVDYGNLDDLVEYGVLEEETAQLSLFNFEKKRQIVVKNWWNTSYYVVAGNKYC